MSWSQPVCEERFREMVPGGEPYRLTGVPEEEWDKCCFCQRPTVIYVRIDPSTVPFPRSEEG